MAKNEKKTQLQFPDLVNQGGSPVKMKLCESIGTKLKRTNSVIAGLNVNLRQNLA